MRNFSLNLLSKLILTMPENLVISELRRGKHYDLLIAHWIKDLRDLFEFHQAY